MTIRTALTEQQAKDIHAWLSDHQESMIEDLAEYVSLESPSDDRRALGKCLDWVRDWLDGMLGTPHEAAVLPRGEVGDIAVCRYAGRGDRPVLLLAHYDTVWPTGTLEQWPFHRDGDRLSGPGVFDMKAGLVQLVWAMRALSEAGVARPSCTVLLNGDEEIGSPGSSEVIVEEARRSRAALVFEASADGAIKTARKGVGLFTVTVHGSEAHAGLDPTAGASAIDELARQIPRCTALRDLDAGTSVNVGVIGGGTRSNVTAGRAWAELDVRVASERERERVDRGLAALTAVDSGTRVEVSGHWNRPVFERTRGVAELAGLAVECAAPLGLRLREASVGGASDGNFVQHAGIPVLDGLGAVGGGAHARHEHATVSGMIERAALAAGVLAALGEDG